MILIGLGAKARQGKNYAATYMQESNPDVRLYAFADELKLFCKENHEMLLTRWQLAHQTKQVPVSKRDSIYGYTAILQWYGTNIARKANPDVWVEALKRRLFMERPKIAIITDVRFENEAAFVKENGGYLVEVVRRNEDGSQYRDSSRDPNHPSETALDDYLGWDFLISCKDGDLKGLKAKAIGVLNILTKKYGSYDEFMDQDGKTSIVVRWNDADSDSTGFKS